ncbi:MAG: SDR family NAD(P)-dependent oxidoreductase [Candidatus Heimdallarchaeota archaeon]|nr:SDR family NAD(P)-dependent oxidoreductase [Candidatus Heimdallarchaeota archaeon]
MSKSKTILITGSTDGIGKELALSLANKDFILIIHGRNLEKGQNLIAKLKSINPNCEVTYVNGDLSSISDVNAMADEILSKFEKIDILVNNAGVIEKKRKLTEDGYERTFMINHLSMFLFTLRILPLVRNNDPSRIINVSSQLHSSSLDLNNLQGEKQFTPTGMYGITKLLNILFTYKLADLLEETNVTVNTLHPGVINTKLLREFWGGSGPTSSKTLEFMVTSPDLDTVSGKYYNNSQITRSSKISYDTELQNKFWSLSETLANITFGIK